MKKRLFGLLIAGMTVITILSGCSGTSDRETASVVLKPGIYTGQSQTSSEEDGGVYAIVKLTVGDDNEIESISFDTFEKNGKKRSSDNGGKADPDPDDQEYAEMIQAVREACESYEEQFMETKDAEKIDAVSGATVSCEQFKEAVGIALQRASE